MRSLVHDLASHEQVEVPYELNGVGQNVALYIAEASCILRFEEIVQTLRQHHREHVLNVKVVVV